MIDMPFLISFSQEEILDKINTQLNDSQACLEDYIKHVRNTALLRYMIDENYMDHHLLLICQNYIISYGMAGLTTLSMIMESKMEMKPLSLDNDKPLAN